jgi:glutamate 5-kinase
MSFSKALNMKSPKERRRIRKELFGCVKRAVVKVGSGVLTHQEGLNTRVLRGLSRDISELMDQGCQVILVSSGAIASGMKKVGLLNRPSDMPQKQATAAVGQPRLMFEYEKAFDRYGKKVAQVLLAREDLCNRKRYLNARNTINVLLGWNVVPIINENDTVVVEELKFGDNDNLSGMITHLMDAQILVNLTDTDGLFDRNPALHKDAFFVPLVTGVEPAMEEAASGMPGVFGMGGMLSKIRTAKKVTHSGIPVVVANGLKPHLLKKLFDGQDLGTLFLPKEERMRSRKCWIAFTLKEQGRILVDRGAAAAIWKHGRSLLPIGILDVEGDFGTGDSVSCVDPDGVEIARGLVNYGASDIKTLKGLRSDQIEARQGQRDYEEVIHRDNLVLTVDDRGDPVCR